MKASIETPIGPLFFSAGGHGMVRIDFNASKVPGSENQAYAVLLRSAARQLEQYFSGERQDFDLPINWSSMTTFQKAVYTAVCSVPFGETRTYRSIAARIGRPNAIRAVGRANATNPLPILIPCHRLVGADGSLRGYGGGLERKAWLLAHESNYSRLE